MHLNSVALILVFLSNIAVIFGSKCEIVRFVNEKNVARKCCALNKKVDDRQSEIFKNQGYVVLQDNQVICRNIEEHEKAYETTTEKNVNESRDGDVGEKNQKKIPHFDIHQFVDSSKRCPDGYVQDFKGNCVEPFE